MHLDPQLPLWLSVGIAVLLVGLLLARLKQPILPGYLMVGIAIGPHGLALVERPEIIDRLGAIGVVLLLFFAGLEVSPARLVRRWRMALVGTTLQIAAILAFVVALGWALDWSVQLIVLIGFAISLSSVVLVHRLAHTHAGIEHHTAEDVTLILLTQEFFLVSMIVVLGFLGGTPLALPPFLLQLAGGAAFIAAATWIASRDAIRLPFASWFERDHEIQVIAGLVLCMGLALLSAVLHLSSAVGAFLAGMLVRAGQQTDWVTRSLKPLEVLAVALFMISIGMMVDVSHLADIAPVVLAMVTVVFVVKTGINAVIVHNMQHSWRESVTAAALLSQIGELSLVLVLLGHQEGIITDDGYHLAIATIASSLLLSPFWIGTIRWFRDRFSSTAPA